MKKKLIGMMCGAAAVAMAVPALAAEVTLSGTYAVQGMAQETSFGKDVSAVNFVAMRFRPKVTAKINDLVSIVYFGEFDIDWGVTPTFGATSTSTATQGPDSNGDTEVNPTVTTTTKVYKGGGGQAGDGINLETKNLYLDLKPSKDFPLSFRIGLQGINDSINNTYFTEDAAGVAAMGAFGPVNLGFGWAKLSEGTTDGATSKTDLMEEDDSDLYFVKASMKPADTVKVGLDVFYKHMDGTDATEDSDTEFTVAPNVALSIAGINVDGFFAYQFGKNDVSDDSNETKASYTASVGASMNVAPAMLGVRAIYYSKDDDANDKDTSFNGNIGELAYVGEGLGIFLADATKTGAVGYHNDSEAIDQAGNGYGLFALTAKAKVDFAPFWCKAAVGYFTALTDDNDVAAAREGKALGTEIAAEIGMKMADVASLSLRGDYAVLGSFYDATVGGEDPDNPYVVALYLTVPF